MSESGKATDRPRVPQPAAVRAQHPSAAYVQAALGLNGIGLPAAEIELLAAELGRAFEIVKPLLDFPLPEGLDQAGIYRA